MEASKTIGAQMDTARQMEKDGRLDDAATIYQKIFNSDPSGQQVIGRLLIIYRKLKDYRKELSVLDDAIAAFRLRQKGVREKWIQSHPDAASAGRSMLRQLEKAGSVAVGLGEDPVVERWMKRKDLVTGRVMGKKGKGRKETAKGHKETAKEHKEATKENKTEARKSAKALAYRHKKAEEKQRQREKAKEKQRQRQEAKEKQRQRKEAVAVSKKAAEERKAEAARRHPSLFVVILRYLVSLEEIDAVMKRHMLYLDKHFENRDFLVSGRLVPRTGGLILARAKDKKVLEKTIKEDPFVKRKLARADIIEFSASQMGKGLERWITK
jgi:uncharacterized protein YciI